MQNVNSSNGDQFMRDFFNGLTENIEAGANPFFAPPRPGFAPPQVLSLDEFAKLVGNLRANPGLPPQPAPEDAEVHPYSDSPDATPEYFDALARDVSAHPATDRFRVIVGQGLEWAPQTDELMAAIDALADQGKLVVDGIGTPPFDQVRMTFDNITADDVASLARAFAYDMRVRESKLRSGFPIAEADPARLRQAIEFDRLLQAEREGANAVIKDHQGHIQKLEARVAELEARLEQVVDSLDKNPYQENTPRAVAWERAKQTLYAAGKVEE